MLVLLNQIYSFDEKHISKQQKKIMELAGKQAQKNK